MILKQLYNGELYPAETVVSKTTRYKEANSRAGILIDQLSKRISEEDYKMLDEIVQEMNTANDEMNFAFFNAGFTLGIKLLSESGEL